MPQAQVVKGSRDGFSSCGLFAGGRQTEHRPQICGALFFAHPDLHGRLTNVPRENHSPFLVGTRRCRRLLPVERSSWTRNSEAGNYTYASLRLESERQKERGSVFLYAFRNRWCRKIGTCWQYDIASIPPPLPCAPCLQGARVALQEEIAELERREGVLLRALSDESWAEVNLVESSTW